MAKDRRKCSKRNISEEEKKRIANDMIKGYKKMADLNLELAEEGMISHDETT